jgi:hypothetical protein
MESAHWLRYRDGHERTARPLLCELSTRLFHRLFAGGVHRPSGLAVLNDAVLASFIIQLRVEGATFEEAVLCRSLRVAAGTMGAVSSGTGLAFRINGRHAHDAARRAQLPSR